MFDWDILPLLIQALRMMVHLTFLLIILQRRQRDPMSTAFWLTLVSIFPLFGFILYLFFGMSGRLRMEKKIAQIQVSMTAPDNSKPETAEQTAGSLLHPLADRSACRETDSRNRLLNRLFPDSPLLSGNKTELLEDGTQAYPRMLEDISNAKTSIRLESYILMHDRSGKEFLRLLKKKAAEGVDVKVLFDSLGSFLPWFTGSFLKISHKKNMSIRAFSQLNQIAPWLFQMRNHRKLLIIDGRIAYTGGINISEGNERFRNVPKEKYIHDLHCRIEGPAVPFLTVSFLRDWAYADRNSGRNRIHPEEPVPSESKGEDRLRILPGGPGNRYEGTMDLFYTAAMEAQKSLTIITPYFVPGPAYIQLLCMTAARGVKISIIVPENNDHKFVDYASRSTYPKLMESGIRIYKKRGYFSHVKALLADDSWGFMGSSNCDSRSFRLNYELDFWFEQGPMAEAMCKKVRAELAECIEITQESQQKKGLICRLEENICALLTPIL